MPPVVRSTSDAVPLVAVQRWSIELPATTVGSGGDTTPCEDTREDYGLPKTSTTKFCCSVWGFQVSLRKVQQGPAVTPVVTSPGSRNGALR